MEKRQYEELREQQNSHWWFVGKKEIVLDFAKTHGGLACKTDNCILDVGCGMGLMLEDLADYGYVYGLEMEQNAVDYCNQLLTEKHINGTVIKGALPDQVPFSDNSMDYIFALDIIEHVQDDKAALKTLYRLLKPDGKLFITVPALMSMWSYNDVLNHHFRRYEKEELTDLIHDSGFNIIKLSFYNSYLYFPAWLVRHIKNVFHINTSDVSSKNNKLSNYMLQRIFTSEKYRLRKNGFKRGVSLIASCIK